MSKVSVAVLSWEGRSHLQVCLPALRDQKDPGVEWEVLVLDNGSSDGTAEWVRREHPEVRLVESASNLGFCAGNNLLAREARGDWIVFLNNDTRPEPGWLAALAGAMAAAADDVAAVSGRIVDWAGERLDFASGILTFDGHAFQRDFGRPLAEVELAAPGSELLFACGGNMLIRKRAFLAAGGFDEDYFAYLEDVDLGWRLWAGGERVLFAPEAVVRHRSMATSQLLGDAHRGFLFERNAYLTAYTNFEDGLWEKMMPAILLTLQHRTQTLLVQSNPGGEQLTFDPYAGLIANTAKQEEPEASAPPAAPEPPRTSLAEKWRGYGPAEFFRRAAAKAWRTLAGERPRPPEITDARTVAQLRAVTYILGNLDRAAAKRARVQARRQRSDREIFRRFPLHIVPTYPGDERLFTSRAFRSWLPADLPFERRSLTEIMELD